MTATLAQSPWPVPAAAAWRFGRAIADGVQWVLRRNCSLSPKQAMSAFAVLAVVSLSIGIGFWLFGARLVLPFAGLEIACLGAAWLVYARHAADRETLTLRRGTLDVEHRCGNAVAKARFRADRVRVEPALGQGSLIELSGQGQRMRVGRYVRAEERDALAQELRRALRGAARQGSGNEELK